MNSCQPAKLPATTPGPCSRPNFFVVCYGLRLAHLQEFLPCHPVSFKVILYYTGCSVSQFLHSLDVNSAFAFTKKYSRCFGGPRRSFSKGGPCTPTSYIHYAKKILIGRSQSPGVVADSDAHSRQNTRLTPHCGTGRNFCGCLLQRLLKILTHYSNTEKNFRFLKEAKILSEFFHSPAMAGRQAEATPQKFRPVIARTGHSAAYGKILFDNLLLE